MRTGLVTALCAAFAVAGGAVFSPRAKGKDMQGYEKPNEAELRQKLTPLQFKVTQEEGTERPFENEFWDNKRPGIYVDVVSGEPLFASVHKYKSGTGWPSFWRPLEEANVKLKDDLSLFARRVEVRSKHGDSHLGHVFEDGPEPTGLRYCINSAALRFVPKEALAAEGYGGFLPLFEENGQRKAAAFETATLAGGCFWGVEDIIRKIPGVISTEVGYTGGTVSNPDYGDVKTGKSGHAEAVQVIFDPSRLTYEQLLGWFFRLHDPTTLNRQGNDVGSQYRSEIFVHDEKQREIAKKIIKEVDASAKWKAPVATTVAKAAMFHKAEDYHQDYLVKNPKGYTCHYLRD